MAREVVCDASPLIFLSRGKHLELLHQFAERVLVPEPVAREILERGSTDVTATALNEQEWIATVPAPAAPEAVLEWGMGLGESSVLAHAHARPGMEAIIDDLMARRCAAALGIPVRGTLGIILTAKRRGVIPSARAVMEDLIGSGLYLSRTVLDEALRRVGE